MKQKFEWFLRNLGEPKWWEETGHPRYCDFSPDKTYNIYADEVALLEIACQDCGRRFSVSMNWSTGEPFPLSKLIGSGSCQFGYGDPPNVGCCPAGPTMGSDGLRVIEFWEKDGNFKWVRIPELEIDLGDIDYV